MKPSGKILCFVEVADLPKDAGREVYRELLAAGLFGLETAGGHFTLSAETETVVYDYLFDFEPAAADPEAFVETLEKILQLCDVWAERIRAILAGGKAPAEDAPNASSSASWGRPDPPFTPPSTRNSRASTSRPSSPPSSSPSPRTTRTRC